VAKAVNLPVVTLERAMKAKAERRELGVNSRPNLLNNDAIECFIDTVDFYLDQREEISYDTAKQLEAREFS
jgi:hypothetical protein